jgi:hypothetical protein
VHSIDQLTAEYLGKCHSEYISFAFHFLNVYQYPKARRKLKVCTEFMRKIAAYVTMNAPYNNLRNLIPIKEVSGVS